MADGRARDEFDAGSPGRRSPDALDGGVRGVAAFAERCAAFVASHPWPAPAPAHTDPRRERALANARTVQDALATAGLAGAAYPEAYGGQGLDEAHERVLRDALAPHVAVLEPLRISTMNCGPVILEYGTEEQKRRWLPGLLSGRAVACQMFSEPEAGSDVAAAKLRAGGDEGGWVLNGQKVWTTYAHLADVGVVLARTDSSGDKHEGLSMFLVELDLPGIEVRPIHQIDGGTEFDEVFFDEVHVSERALLGRAGDGWTVASAVMRYQRLARGAGMIGGITHELFDRLAGSQAASLADPVHRDALIGLYIAEIAQSLVALRTRAATVAGRQPGPIGSLTKLIAAEVEARFSRLSFEILGADAQAWTDEAGGRWAQAAVFALSRSIAGGTSEIQRNIIGERVLGLPREARVAG